VALVALGLALASVLWSRAAGLGADEQMARRLQSEQAAMRSAWQQAVRLRAQPAPGSAVDQMRLDAQADQADYAFRQAVREEQVTIYQLAANPALEDGVLRHLGSPSDRAGLEEATEGLRALWRGAGISNFATVHPRHNHSALEATPVSTLLAYYRSAAATYGIDWTVLAAMNYIESDFGRNDGPSAAGAEGPMQFLPSTWRAYGHGDIMSPHDAIMSAAGYLKRLGAPADYDRAILGYNHDRNYLAAVKDFAAAIRSDPLWLQRLYYWSTYG
jgi:hypothetical protein